MVESTEHDAGATGTYFFSETIRSKMMKMNPFRAPCIYKAVLEENAVKTLANLSDLTLSDAGSLAIWEKDSHNECWTTTCPLQGKDGQESSSWISTQTPSTMESPVHNKPRASLDDLSGINGAQLEEEVTGCPPSSSAEKESAARTSQVKAWSDSTINLRVSEATCGEQTAADKCFSYLIDDLFSSQSIRADPSSPRKGNGESSKLSPWRICSSLHSPQQLWCQNRAPAEASIQYSSLVPINSSESPAGLRAKHGRVRSSQVRKPKGAICRTESSEYIKPQKLLHSRACMETTGSSPSVGAGTASKTPSRGNTDKQKTIREPASPAKPPITYPFEHSRSHRTYMSLYRKVHTYMGLYNSFSKPLQDLSYTEAKWKPSKVLVDCKDVREGAALKVSQFQFNVNSRFRTAINNGQTKETRPKDDHPKCTLTGSDPTLPLTESPPPHRRALCIVGSSPSPPIVCRSRPSIPSNARGIVCPTAVETPSHVVHVLYSKGTKDQGSESKRNCSPVARPKKERTLSANSPSRRPATSDNSPARGSEAQGNTDKTSKHDTLAITVMKI